MTSDALITSLHIILDKVMTAPSSKSKKPDRTSPMEIEMAAKADVDETRDDEEQRLADLSQCESRSKVQDTKRAGAWA